MKREVYQHPEGVGSWAPIVVLIGAVGAVFLALGYTVVAIHSWMCFAPFLFLLLVNLWIGKIIYFAKCRSSRLGALIGAIVTAAFLYAAWAFMCDATLQAADIKRTQSHSTIDAFSPLLIWETANSVLKSGWAFRWPNAANGWWLIALWLLEVVVFLWVGIRWGRTCSTIRPFCIRSNGWMKKISGFGLYKWPRDEALVNDLLAGNVARVLELKQFSDDEVESEYSEEIKVDVWVCPRPENGGVFEATAYGYFDGEPPQEWDENFTAKPFTGECQKVWISVAEVELLREFFGKTKRKRSAEIPLAKPINDQSTNDGFDSSLR